MMALAGVEPETLVSEPDALTTRPPPCAQVQFLLLLFQQIAVIWQMQFLVNDSYHSAHLW